MRRKPYSIVLLDEIEKAHGNVFNMLLQVLDEGRLTDGNGRLVDFRNTIIIMTSNAGTRQLKEFGRGIGFGASAMNAATLGDKDKEHARSIIQKSLSKQFSPEFLNRLDEIITFDQLDLNAIKRIVDLELKPLTERVEQLGYHLQLSPEAKEQIEEARRKAESNSYSKLSQQLELFMKAFLQIMDGHSPEGQALL